jgi:hypothetical protein
MEFFGLLDDIFAMYRKEEMDEGKNMLHYHYYQGLNSVKNGYTVYLGQVVDEVRALLKRLQEEEKFQFTDEDMKEINFHLNDTTAHQSDWDNPTELNFRAKYDLMFALRDILPKYPEVLKY